MKWSAVMLAFCLGGYFCHNGVDRKSQIVKNMINENGCTRLLDSACILS